MALGFDVPEDGSYNRVHYRRRRLPAPLGREIDGQDVDDILLTKFSAWRYESEYRAISRLSDGVQVGKLYFEPFSETLKLAQVIVGDRSPVSRAQLARALGSSQARVAQFKARPAFKTFAVVRNRDARLWT